MRKAMFAVALIIAGLFVMWAPASTQGPIQSQRVGYLNSQPLLQAAPGADTIQPQIQLVMQRVNNQLQAMQDTLTQMMDEFQQRSTMLTPDERTRRQQAIETRRVAFQQRAAILQDSAAARQELLLRPIYDAVERAIEAVRAEEGFALIFDVGVPNSALVAADTTLDLTSRVLNRLRSGG